MWCRYRCFRAALSSPRKSGCAMPMRSSALSLSVLPLKFTIPYSVATYWISVLGVVTGAGDGTLSGYLFDTDAPVETGDTLITSGMGLYPESIPIGRVISYRSDADSRLVYLTAEPFVDFSRLDRVTVIKMTGSAE